MSIAQGGDVPFADRIGKKDDTLRRSPKAGGSAELHHLPGGRAITPAASTGAAYVLPHHPVRITRTAAATNVYLQPGGVIHRHLLRASNLVWLDSEIGGTSLFANPAPSLTLSLNAANGSWNYLKLSTDKLGHLTADPAVISSNAALTSIHHHPDDPGTSNTGSTGTYYLEIFRTHFDATDSTKRVQLKYGGNPVLDQALTKIEPVGGGAEITKQFNQSTATWWERTLTELASNPQIRVTQQTNTVLIRGNSFDTDLIAVHQDGGSNVTLVDFHDGLAQSLNNINIRNVNVCTTNGVVEWEILTK